MTKTNPPVVTNETIYQILEAVRNGAQIADICNVSKEQLENLYALAYSLYTAGNFKDACTVFQALCIYDNLDIRFWMGLGGSRQALGDYQAAIDAYSMGGTIETFNNPEPFLYCARCFLKMGKKEEALVTLRGILEIANPANPDHLKVKAVAEALIDLLTKKA